MKYQMICLSLAMVLSLGILMSECPSLQAENLIQEENMEDYIVIRKPAINVIGIQCRTSNAPEKGPLDIPRLWDKFYSESVMEQVPNKASHDVIALYCDYEGDHTQPYSLVIGCAVSSLANIPDGMVAKTIPGGFYAVYKAVGEHPASLIETWGNIWQTDLNRIYTGDYELYGEEFHSDSKEVKVFIAIDQPKNIQ